MSPSPSSVEGKVCLISLRVLIWDYSSSSSSIFRSSEMDSISSFLMAVPDLIFLRLSSAATRFFAALEIEELSRMYL